MNNPHPYVLPPSCYGKKSVYSVDPKASISLASVIGRKKFQRQPAPAARSAGFVGQDPQKIHESDLVSIIVESSVDSDLLSPSADAAKALSGSEEIKKLEGSFFSAKVGTKTLQTLIHNPDVHRLQSKKLHVPHLDKVSLDVGILTTAGKRAIAETGKGVLIGIVDTGFDLAHPMFSSRGNLRVDALLDQTTGKEYTTAQLSKAWSKGTGPGADEDGHGTHVASIAAGSSFKKLEGIAPDARLLLVKTDFINTDDAVAWIFKKAKGIPCVINMSLGHHFGSHDGTDAEERFHRTTTGPGKIIVVSAGNERDDRIHIGRAFKPGDLEVVLFDVQRTEDLHFVTLTLWHDERDTFDVELITPSGQVLPLPTGGAVENYQSSVLDIETATRPYVWSNSVQIQISLSFKNEKVRTRDLRNWKLRISCRVAVIGRIDGWFHNSGYAVFRNHLLVEPDRTVGICATGDGCIAVASHVTRNSWSSDVGVMNDGQVVLGKISPFSSLGPTRDGRRKPDVSAPGQYVTAALADQSELASSDDRAQVNARLVTIEGTSMAAPAVTGLIALMLQKKGTLDVAQARTILIQSVRSDAHTGPNNTWHPAYGFGKVDVLAALNKLP